MRYQNKFRHLWLFGIAGVVLFLLFLSAQGCGKGDGSKEVAVRHQTPPRPAPRPVPLQTPRPARVDSSAQPAGPEVVAPPEPLKAVTYEEAELAYNERRYQAAAELFTIYTEQKPENPWGFYMLGLSTWKAGDLATAEESFEQAILLDSRHVKSYLNLARVLLDTRRPSDALTQIDEALAIDPTSTVAYRLRGRAFRQTGEKNAAIEAYRRALTLDDTDVWSMNNMALIYIEDGMFEQALPPLARAVELQNDVPVFLNNLGMALEGTGRFRAAEAAYQSAVDNDGGYDKAAVNLARVSNVLEDPSVEPLDLAALAQRFTDEIGTWSISQNEKPGGPVIGVIPQTLSPADSTLRPSVATAGADRESDSEKE